MSELDQLAATIGKVGEGEWELTLEDGETVEATLTDVDVDENRGLEARVATRRRGSPSSSPPDPSRTGRSGSGGLD